MIAVPTSRVGQEPAHGIGEGVIDELPAVGDYLPENPLEQEPGCPPRVRAGSLFHI